MPRQSEDAPGPLFFNLDVRSAPGWFRTWFSAPSFRTSSIVDAADLGGTRHAILSSYGGNTIHASPMFAMGEMRSLRQAVDLVAVQHDGLDILVHRQIQPDDIDGRIARASCFKLILTKTHDEFGW
jgi:hypothetical protein